MRLRSLDLIAFGPFENKKLRFDHDGALEVVFGPNEAGKSTTRRAILGLLFGIPERSKDGHSTPEVRVGATLVTPDGKMLDVVRRKGRKNTLLTPAGDPLDPAVMSKLLGGIDAATFELAYGLDHEGLRMGGAALRVGQGEVGESLFSAATGLTGLHAILQQQRQEADALYVPRGIQRPLNEAQRAYAEAKKRVAELATPADKWLEVQKQIEKARADLASLRAERGALATEHASARASAEAARAVVGHRARAAEIEQVLTQTRAELGMLAPTPGLLERAQVIVALQERLDSHRKGQIERPRALAELDASSDRATRSRRDAPKPIGTPPSEARVRKLALEGASLRERCKQLEGRTLEAALMKESAERSLAALGPAADVEGVRRVVELAQSEGDLEGRLEILRASVARERAAVDKKVAALGASFSHDELLRAPVPSLETVSALAAALKDAAERRRQSFEQQRRAREDRADAERLLSVARAEGDVPDEEALAEARVARDALWESIRDGGAKAKREANRFERAMHAVDELADRLRHEAARVTRVREGEATVVATSQKLAAAEGEGKALDAELSEATRAWEALWSDVGVRARSPEEMTAWLARHETAVAAAQRLNDAEQEVDLQRAAITRVRRTLELALHGGKEEDEPLAHLVQRARSLVAAGDAATASRIAQERALETAKRATEETARTVASYERDRAEHVHAWDAVTEALGLRAGADAEEVLAALGVLATLARMDEEIVEVRRRIEAIDREAAQFVGEVKAACGAAAPDLVGRSPEDACAELGRRLALASEQRARREALEEQERRLEGQLRAAREAVDEGAKIAREAPEVADQRAAGLEARIADIEERIHQTNRHLGSVETGAKQFPESPASEAASKAQQELARLRDLVERYARARLAAAAVGRLVERYRRENQGPVLARASALFATLTLGGFDGLEVGFGESDEPVIVAMRGAQRLETEALSDGALDQLYLALRVASLERSTEARGPLPLLLDDVLVHFDDQRAAAALAILSELAHRTQVILFTHHQRIVDIAQRSMHDRDGATAAGIHDLGA